MAARVAAPHAKRPELAADLIAANALKASVLRDSDARRSVSSASCATCASWTRRGAHAESLVKNAPDPVFVSDLGGKILQANDSPPDDGERCHWGHRRIRKASHQRLAIHAPARQARAPGHASL
jgi:hypothetical protein